MNIDIALLVNVTLAVLFVSAALTDIKWQRIYNLQTFPAIVCGLILGFAAGGLRGGLDSFLGLIVGMALLFFFYLLGGIGAGDVKLLGAIGALKGSTFVVWTMFYAGLVGGVMALTVIIWQGTVTETLKNLWFFVRHPVKAQSEESGPEPHYLPYGLAISIGCFLALVTV